MSETPETPRGPIAQAAAEVYAEWPVTEMEDGTGFAVDVEGSDGEWSALAITDDESQRFVFYSLSPVDAAPDRLGAMGELLHRINHGLVEGTFELDWDSGEVRLRSGIDMASLPPSVFDPELLRAIVSDVSTANIGIFDLYLSGLVAVSLGAEPAQVVAQLESGFDED
jgi:hypothetical protein